jgi:hypothetical protein
VNIVQQHRDVESVGGLHTMLGVVKMMVRVFEFLLRKVSYEYEEDLLWNNHFVSMPKQ